MKLRQRHIPDPAPITDQMTHRALGTGPHDLIGTVVCVYDIPDSDRSESLLRFADGRVICVSCDPGYDEQDQRTPTSWDVVLYDATDTEAGRLMQDLAPGHWL